jgi:hypothetical protein
MFQADSVLEPFRQRCVLSKEGLKKKQKRMTPMRKQISMRRQAAIALAAGTLMAGVCGMSTSHIWRDPATSRWP